MSAMDDSEKQNSNGQTAIWRTFAEQVQPPLRELTHREYRYKYLHWESTFEVRTPGFITETLKVRHPFGVIAAYQATPADDVYVGVSRCSEHDRFVKAVGRAIAEGRAQKRAFGHLCLWTVRLRARSEEIAVFEGELRGLRLRSPCSYLQGENMLRDFCRRVGIQTVDYRGGELAAE